MDVSSLANSLVGVHAMMAVGLKAPEMAISEEEAKRLAGPIIELQKYYKVPFDPKWVAWFQLVSAAGAVYLPRAVMIGRRAQIVRAQQAQQRQQAAPTEGLGVDIPHPEEAAPISDIPQPTVMNFG